MKKRLRAALKEMAEDWSAKRLPCMGGAFMIVKEGGAYPLELRLGL